MTSEPKLLKQFLKSFPLEKQLNAAIIYCLDHDIDAYSGLALFYPNFEAVSWFTQFVKLQEKNREINQGSSL